MVSIDKKLIQTRIMYGFLGKRSSGKIKYFAIRWFFLIYIKPLNFNSYSEDPRVMDETLIPPLLELDTIYYYIMGKKEDTSGSCGEIKAIEILDIMVKDMSKSKSEEGHALIIDAGKFKVHLNTLHKFELEKWNEAIRCSMQTAREKVLSITGSCRNISK